MVKINRQSAAKHLNIEDIKSMYDEGSTTIPSGSRLLSLLSTETPDIRFKNIFRKCVDKDSCIYLIINIKTLQFYIGSAKNLQLRMRKHRYSLRHKHWNYKFRQIKNIDDFYYAILKVTNNLEKEELEYIKKYKNDFNDLILNISEDTKRNFMSSETLEKIKNQNKHRMRSIFCYGLDGKFIVKFKSISEASRMLGLQRSNIRKCLNNEVRYLKKFTFRDFYAKEITIRDKNISHVLKNIEKSKKKVIEVNSSKIYRSISEAERKLGIPRGTLSYKISHKKNYGKYLFKFYEDIV